MMTGNDSPPNAVLFENHLQDQSSLHQRYFALRHGQSLANVAGIIASDPAVACHKYGLSPVGREQAAEAGRDLVDRLMSLPMKDDGNDKDDVSPAGVVIVTSDLLRAKETAEIVAEAVRLQAATLALYTNNVIVDTRLRERAFGSWDGQNDRHYYDVWKDDIVNPYHEIQGVESVWSVTDRATQCVLEWDEKLCKMSSASASAVEVDDDGKSTIATSSSNRPWWVICVAHGDVLQILQTAFCKMDPAQHRSMEHLETATLRPLELSA